MAKLGVRYQLADNRNVTLIYTLRDGELAMQYDPSTQGLIELPLDHPAAQKLDKYTVRDGAVVAKAPVMLTADKPSFAADGVTECRITATGLVGNAAIYQRPGRDPLTLTLADPVLILTSDVGRRYTFQVLDAAHYSEPLTVEAK